MAYRVGYKPFGVGDGADEAAKGWGIKGGPVGRVEDESTMKGWGNCIL